MKWVLCLMTLLVLVTLEAAEIEFQAGAATSNITPKMGVPLDGTIMQIGPARHVHDELWARCLVLSDGETKLAFAIVDNTMISQEVHAAAKAQIERELGIPPQNVCISATHTHSTPRALQGLVDNDLHREYLDFVAVRIADGIRRAHNNLTPAEAGWGSFEEPRFVHNRRWFVKKATQSPFGDDGETVKMNPSRMGNDLDRPAGPVDPEVFIFALRRKLDHQPIAVMGNYGLHYVGGIPGGTVSADYFGEFSDQIKNRWGEGSFDPPCVGLMTNGTSGDVNANDFSVPVQKFPPYERMIMVADQLTTGAQRVLEDLSWQADLTLGSAAVDLVLSTRKPDSSRIAWAEETRARADTRIRLTRPQIYAREALFLAAYPATVTIPLQAFRIGGLAITQSPCETFAETGLAIKADSPFPNATFTIELANGYAGYLPPEKQFDYGGYETWPARSSFLEKGAEGKIREGLLKLLDRLSERTD